MFLAVLHRGDQRLLPLHVALDIEPSKEDYFVCWEGMRYLQYEGIGQLLYLDSFQKSPERWGTRSSAECRSHLVAGDTKWNSVQLGE